MLNFKTFCISFVLISIRFQSVILDDRCDKVFVIGEEEKLQNLFDDFNTMMSKVREVNQLIPNYEQLAINSTDLESNNELHFDIRYDTLPKHCVRDTLPRDCAEATACTRRSGIYKIEIPNYEVPPFLVECDDRTDGGDWIVIQRREDGSVDFYRDWRTYEKGFGDVDGELFIGLQKLYALTNKNGPQELLVVMELENGKTAAAKYNTFTIASARKKYKLLRVGHFSGSGGDSLTPHVGYMFSTKDRDNDVHRKHCARLAKGAWWYFRCHYSNLNGQYGSTAYGTGINWYSFTGAYKSLKFCKMMIRRRRL